MTSKYTFVLLHGAGLGGWIWDQVVDHLKSPYLAIDLPGRSGNFDFSNIRIGNLVSNVLEKIEVSGAKKVILVAHSVTGPLALAIHASRPDLIESLVFVGAAIPRNGRSYADCLPFVSRFFLKLLAKIYPKGLKAPEKIAQKVLCNDINDTLGRTIVSKMVAEAPCLFLDAVQWIQPQKAVYIRLLRDKTDLTPASQAKMAALITKCRIIDVNSGHLPMLSQAAALSDALNAMTA
jgi:pimeloyl-ACP methyl ester carboxylesterase